MFLYLGGASAGRQNLLYGLGQNPVAGQNADTSRFWMIFLKIIIIVGKSLAHTVGKKNMHPNPPKCNIRQKSRTSTILQIKEKSLIPPRYALFVRYEHSCV